MHLKKPIWATALVATLFVAAACGSSSAPEAPSTPTLPPVNTSSVSPASLAPSTPKTPPAATPTAVVDLSALDACTVLDEQTLQELTGTSRGFISGSDESDGPNQRGCFWPTTTIAPQYVELFVYARPDGLAGSTGTPGNWDCATMPVGGVGSEAVGGTCVIPGSSQNKVFLTAWDNGVGVTLIVNEPERPLEPEDIGPTIESLFEGLD